MRNITEIVGELCRNPEHMPPGVGMREFGVMVLLMEAYDEALLGFAASKKSLFDVFERKPQTKPRNETAFERLKRAVTSPPRKHYRRRDNNA